MYFSCRRIDLCLIQEFKKIHSCPLYSLDLATYFCLFFTLKALSAAPDCLPSVTEVFRSPLLASGTVCLILSLPQLP